MIVVCPSCQSRFKFDESKLGDRPKARTKCSKCGGAIEIENPLLGSSTLPPNTLPAPAPAPAPAAPEVLQTRKTPVQPSGGVPPAIDAGATLGGADAHRMGLLQLPKDKRFSLAVIQGGATGQIFPISKTRTVVGRWTPRRRASTRRSRSWATWRSCATSDPRTAPGSSSTASSSTSS